MSTKLSKVCPSVQSRRQCSLSSFSVVFASGELRLRQWLCWNKWTHWVFREEWARNSLAIRCTVLTLRFNGTVLDGTTQFFIIMVTNCVMCDLIFTNCKTSCCIKSIHSGNMYWRYPEFKAPCSLFKWVLLWTPDLALQSYTQYSLSCFPALIFSFEMICF